MNWFCEIFKRPKDGESVVDPLPSHPEPERLEGEQQGVLAADNPIRKISDDKLGRTLAAESFASNVLQLDASEGVVVGVLGTWGFGKTSFVNLARPTFEQRTVPILDFNPWMFSGAEQLVQSFFSELSAQLKLRPGLGEVGKGLEEYGEMFSSLAWVPIVGPWIERGQDLTKLIANLMQRKKEGIGSQRAKVDKALRRLQKPIVVVLDDIDRLNTSEIRDIFKLVRLTANFPNIIYILAFDRKRVEDALTEQGIPGRAYLEKILQLGFDLPTVPERVLNQQIIDSITAVLDGIPNSGNFDANAWPDVFMEVIKPLISNMRDVRRYAAAIGGTVRSLNGQIALIDVLALEAIRVFLPDVFQRFPISVAGLTITSDIGYGAHREETHLKQEIKGLLDAAEDKATVVQAMIQRLFMAAQRHVGGSHYGADWSSKWLRERRVAHADIFRLYLERVAGQGLLAFNLAERAWALMPEGQSFDVYLRGLNPDQAIDAISSLAAYEDEITQDRVVPGITTLLNILQNLPEQERGMFSLGTQIVVERVIYRLIHSQNSEDFVEATVRKVLPQLTTLFAKLTLIQMVGHRDRIGHKLISAAVSNELEAAWRTELRTLNTEELIREPKLLRSLLVLKRESGADEPTLAVPPDLWITHSLLLSARSEVRIQAMGNRAVTRSPRLAWEILVELYEGEDVLRTRLEELRLSPPPNTTELLQLADRYLSGWRPKD
ncbi:MAG: hypothetical protein NPIRA05_11480 [Nitrospirales bacterium]|nr:MAG: hypothetical protein NPIRA05_11480 [Nitrospirales bacterium]